MLRSVAKVYTVINQGYCYHNILNQGIAFGEFLFYLRELQEFYLLQRTISFTTDCVRDSRKCTSYITRTVCCVVHIDRTLFVL